MCPRRDPCCGYTINRITSDVRLNKKSDESHHTYLLRHWRSDPQRVLVKERQGDSVRSKEESLCKISWGTYTDQVWMLSLVFVRIVLFSFLFFSCLWDFWCYVQIFYTQGLPWTIDNSQTVLSCELFFTTLLFPLVELWQVEQHHWWLSSRQRSPYVVIRVLVRVFTRSSWLLSIYS